ncbi:MAG: DUF362 domain-containing protein [Polyangiaceae bacterium]
MLSRRNLLRAGAALGASALPLSHASHEAHAAPAVVRPPAGFSPLKTKGRVVKVSTHGSFAGLMQNNQLWPKADVAERMVEKALMELTGASNLSAALGKFIHPKDKVAIKVNGLAGQHGHTMAANFEVIDPVVRGLIALGVPADRIMVFEQTQAFLEGARVNVRAWQLPKGVKTGVHKKEIASMTPIEINKGIPMRFVTLFMDATAVIDISQIKDHSIYGYTGAIKNISHGTQTNPHDQHDGDSDQPARIYAHSIVRSRMRLHIVDGFKLLYDGGPHDNPRGRSLHGAVYASTDAVALDTVGVDVVNRARKERKIKSLSAAGRDPRYIRAAADLKVGAGDLNKIRLSKRYL